MQLCSTGLRSVEVAERPDPVIEEPTDAVVRVVLACVCGSDLWYWRGQSDHAVGSIGHEFIGVVEETGAEVHGVKAGDLVIAPFIFSDMSCPHCLNGSTISCERGGTFGNGVIDGGQGEAVRVPLAGSTLVTVPGSGHSDETLKSLLTLSDVMATGHHAAVCAGVKPGDTVAVVGDGAVGLSAVLASKRLAPSASSPSAATPNARSSPWSSAPPTSSNNAATRPSKRCWTSLKASAPTPPWSASVPPSPSPPPEPSPGPAPPSGSWASPTARSRSWAPSSATSAGDGGPAPARIYIPDLLPDVLDGSISPGLVFDYETDLDHLADAYQAMDGRRAIKSLIRVES